MAKLKYSNEELKEAIKHCNSMASTLKYMGMTIYGSNYIRLKRMIRDLDIDISHFKGKGWNKGNKNAGKGAPLETILVSGSSYTNMSLLKKRVVEAGVLKYECAVCLLKGTWNNKPLTLHLDHKNGLHNDHRPENIRFICPNCHSQTPTYSGKNKGRVPQLV